jgi:uncharacterized delta-60 repeat protein
MSGVIAGVIAAIKGLFSKGGASDPAFTTYDNSIGFAIGYSGNSALYLSQPDGKFIVASGGLSSYRGIATPGGVVRINSDGTLDSGFVQNIGTGGNYTLRTLVLQPDGKIIIGGDFTTWKGETAGGIVRLSSDGTVDNNFKTNIGTAGNSGGVYSVALLSDGSIIVGGQFTTWNGASANKLVKLDSNGNRITLFSTNVGSGTDGWVTALAIDSSNNIFVGCSNGGSWNGGSGNALVKLNSSGAKDPTFMGNTGSGGAVYDGTPTVSSVSISPLNGKILISGSMETWDGLACGDAVILNTTGIRDTTSLPSSAPGSGLGYNQSAFAQDGSALFFTYVSSFTTIIRYTTSGVYDTAYAANVGTNKSVYSIYPQTDGTLIVVTGNGPAGLWGTNKHSGLVKLNANGTFNTSLPSNLSIQYAASSAVLNTVELSDRSIIACGGFTSWNGVSVGQIVKLSSSGNVDQTFLTNSGTGITGTAPRRLVKTADDKIFVFNTSGGGFKFNGSNRSSLVRLNPNGTVDDTFPSFSLSGPAGSTIFDVALQSTGKAIISGTFLEWPYGAGQNFSVSLIRVDNNGTYDSSFSFTHSGNSTGPSHVKVLSDDSVIIAGSSFYGRIRKLGVNGETDTQFSANVGTTPTNNLIYGITVQPDNKILVFGQLRLWNGTPVNRIIRLKSDGTPDTEFNNNVYPGLSGQYDRVTNASVLKNGQIVLAISPRSSTWKGTAVNSLVRLNSDGTLDSGFTTNVGVGLVPQGTSNEVERITPLSDGNFIVSGEFVSYNGVIRSRIAKIGGGAAS